MTELDDLLHTDPLSNAEKLTGRSYKDDDATAALGLLLAFSTNDRKDTALMQAGDTHFSMEYRDHLKVWKRLGFQTVLQDVTPGTNHPSETLTVLWHPDGLLGVCESYTYSIGGHVATNSSKLYYNWRPSASAYANDVWWRVVSSGGPMKEGIWPGDHDTREGLAHKLSGLREHGDFAPVWQRRPWLNMIGYGEWNDISQEKDYAVRTRRREQVTAERISRLPQHVRDAISG